MCGCRVRACCCCVFPPSFEPCWFTPVRLSPSGAGDLVWPNGAKPIGYPIVPCDPGTYIVGNLTNREVCFFLSSADKYFLTWRMEGFSVWNASRDCTVAHSTFNFSLPPPLFRFNPFPVCICVVRWVSGGAIQRRDQRRRVHALPSRHFFRHRKVSLVGVERWRTTHPFTPRVVLAPW